MLVLEVIVIPNLIKIEPFTMVNESYPLFNQSILQCMSSISEDFEYKNFSEPPHVLLQVATTEKLASTAFTKLNQSVFLHVVSETTFCYPYNVYGEKIMRPISSFRPFVLLSTPGALQDIKDLGFKTFDRWWDESYDLEKDAELRFLKVLKIIEQICSMSVSNLQTMCKDMISVLQHNYDYYYGDFSKIEKEKFDLACQQNLLPR